MRVSYHPPGAGCTGRPDPLKILVMRRLTFLLRCLITVVALAQPLLPGAAAVLDGTLAQRAGTAEATSHVEDAGRAGCPFVHDGDCGVCHYLAVAALPTPPRDALEPAPALIAVGGARAVSSSVQQRARPPSRGPPLA